MDPIWALGLMTGTVLDGNIDIALIKTDGDEIFEFGPYELAPYPPEVNAVIAKAVEAARAWNFEGREPALFRMAETMLTMAQANAVAAFLKKHGYAASDVGVIGLHGQTVLHRAPEEGRRGATRQLGDGAAMARHLSIDVAYDFRSADVAAGGQGAPLAAIYHAALLRHAKMVAPAAVLNLGGVGNLTWWGGGNNLISFDTGPANGPINDWMKSQIDEPMDVDGALARSGSVDEVRVQELLNHPYFSKVPPKSLDRYDFQADMADGYRPENGAALLTAFAAACVSEALRILPGRPDEIVVCGGGRKNSFLMQQIAERARVPAVSADTKGWRGDAIEAECFAYLAVRTLRGLPISFPATTGAPHPMTGGTFIKAADLPPLPEKSVKPDPATESDTETIADVRCAVVGLAGCITLSRPKSLNALTQDMVRDISDFLDACAANPAVELVIIDGEGDKAFCAGGDIRSLYEDGLAENFEGPQQFWREEYALNVKIKTFPKPFVALIDGIDMGGGVGVSCHGSHRVVTEHAKIAMPECAIGLIPDVGVSAILASTGSVGRYLALTGHRMDAADAIYAKFADYFVKREDLAALKARLIEIGDPTAIMDIAEDPGPSMLQAHQDFLDQFFAEGSAADIALKLEADETEFGQASLSAMAHASPLSAACTLAVIDELGPDAAIPDAAIPDASIKEAVQREYRFTHRALQDGELLEGIRAAVIDKDRTPNWRHQSFADVTDADIDAMTTTLGEDELSLDQDVDVSEP